MEGKPEGKRPLGKPRRRWEDMKLDLQAVGCGGIDCIDLALDRERRLALVNAVMNFRVPKTRAISRLDENWFDSQARLSSIHGLSK